MEEVSRLYGFYGVEPNTILMGWSQKPENRSAFSRLLSSYDQSGFNIVLLNYNSERNFGKGNNIDLWWSGSGPNLSFSLVLLRHLTTSQNWEKASLRLLVINYDRSRKEQIYRSLSRVLEDYRLDMDIKIIHNQDSSIDEFEIMYRESSQADLTFFGIDDEHMRVLDKIFPDYCNFLSRMGTTALIHAAPGFETVDAGVVRDKQTAEDSKEIPGMAVPLSEFPELKDPALAAELKKAENAGNRVLQRFYEKAVRPCFSDHTEHIENFRGTVTAVGTSLEKAMEYKDAYRYKKTLLKIKNDYMFSCRRLFEQIGERQASGQKESLASGIGFYVDWFTRYYTKLPRRLKLPYPDNEILPNSTDSIYLRWTKIRKRTLLKLFGQPAFRAVPFRETARYFLHDTRLLFLADYLLELQEYQVAHLNHMKSLMLSRLDSIVHLENKFPSDEETILRLQKDLEAQIDEFAEERNRAAESFRNRLQIEFREGVIALARSLQAAPNRRFRPPKQRRRKYYSTLAGENREFPDRWSILMQRVTNKIKLDIQIAALRCRTEDKAEDLLRRATQNVDVRITNPLRNLLTNLNIHRAVKQIP